MSKTVLVVDDDPDIRLFSVSVLEENGYTPLEATDGEEGMKLVRDKKPDLIILDVMMPRQSGIKLYREVKTDPDLKHIPVIVLSGIARKSFLRSQEVRSKADNMPVVDPDAYLEKPVDPDDLLNVIKKIVG